MVNPCRHEVLNSKAEEQKQKQQHQGNTFKEPYSGKKHKGGETPYFTLREVGSVRFTNDKGCEGCKGSGRRGKTHKGSRVKHPLC